MKDQNQNKQTHPSFAVASVGRISGQREHLFGSCGYGGNHIQLTLSLASVVQQGMSKRNLFMEEKQLIQVAFTPLQFAQLIAGVSNGVPCTLTFYNGKAVPPCPVLTTEEARLQAEFQKSMAAMGKQCDDLLEKARELHAKPSVTKADRNAFVMLATELVARVVKGQPYMAQCFAEFVEAAIAEVKAERASAIAGQSSLENSPVDPSSPKAGQ